jgi:ligand-binding sensor domain-containing protein
MRFNITLKMLNSTIWCLFLFSGVLNCQTYSFKNYGAEKNIPNGFIYTINQSNDGFLWVGTGIGLSRFDGFNFFPVQYPDSVAGRYPTASLKDKIGTLWFGCSDGSVFFTEKNKLITVPFSNSKRISSMLEGADGRIYVIPQGEAVYSINPKAPNEIHKYSFSGNPVMLSASFIKSGKLLIGTQENILVCRMSDDSVLVENEIGGFNYSSVTAIHGTQDSTRFVIGTDGIGLFELKMSERGNEMLRFHDHPEWENLRVQSISEDSDNNLWISTFGSGVIQLELSNN